MWACVCVYYIFTNIEIERNGEHILDHFFPFCKPYSNQSRQDSRQAYWNFALQVKMTSPELALNPWSAKFTKWSNILKQFVGKKRVKLKKKEFCSISMNVITTRLFRIVDQQALILARLTPLLLYSHNPYNNEYFLIRRS